jgi:hypothetical protein
VWPGGGGRATVLGMVGEPESMLLLLRFGSPI